MPFLNEIWLSSKSTSERNRTTCLQPHTAKFFFPHSNRYRTICYLPKQKIKKKSNGIDSQHRIINIVSIIGTQYSIIHQNITNRWRCLPFGLQTKRIEFIFVNSPHSNCELKSFTHKNRTMIRLRCLDRSVRSLRSVRFVCPHFKCIELNVGHLALDSRIYSFWMR